MPLDHIYDALQTTEKTIVESLPTRKQAITAVATAKVGRYHGDKMMMMMIKTLDKHLRKCLTVPSVYGKPLS